MAHVHECENEYCLVEELDRAIIVGRDYVISFKKPGVGKYKLFNIERKGRLVTKEKIFVIYIYTFVHYLYWIEKEFINELERLIILPGRARNKAKRREAHYTKYQRKIYIKIHIIIETKTTITIIYIYMHI